MRKTLRRQRFEDDAARTTLQEQCIQDSFQGSFWTTCSIGKGIWSSASGLTRVGLGIIMGLRFGIEAGLGLRIGLGIGLGVRLRMMVGLRLGIWVG